MITTGRNQQSHYRFDAFEFDGATGELVHDGERVTLRPQVAAVLALLLERAGSLVTRQELRDELWHDGRIVSFDMAISTVVRQLRRALADDPKDPRYVETIPKRGYRFLAPVERFHVPRRAIPAARQRPPVLGRVAGLVFLTLASLFLGGTASPPPTRSSNTHDAQLVAVLPFANLTGEAAQDVMAHAVSDSLIDTLSRLAPSRLRVAGRTSVQPFAGVTGAAPRAAAELGADYVLEGSLTREDEATVVRARLVSGTDGSVTWSEAFRQAGDPPELTARAIAARAVQGAVGAGLVPEFGGTQPASSDPAAMAAYREGCLIRDYRGPEDMTAALDRFREAVRLDPGFAAAHAALAAALVDWRGPRKTPERVAEARGAAQRALALDPDLAEAHRALGEIHLFHDGDWDAAGRRLARAVDLAPGNADTHHSLALWLSARGRHGEALSEIGLARELDPRSLAVSLDVMFIHFYARDYAGTIEAARRLHRNWPENPGAPRFIVLAEIGRGNLAAAAGKARDQMSGWAASRGQELPATLDDDAAAVRAYCGATANALTRARESQPVDPAAIAMYEVCAGHPDRAMAQLDQALAQPAFSYFVPYLGVAPALDPLRGSLAFERALRRLGQAGLSGIAEGPELTLTPAR